MACTDKNLFWASRLVVLLLLTTLPIATSAAPLSPVVDLAVEASDSVVVTVSRVSSRASKIILQRRLGPGRRFITLSARSARDRRLEYVDRRSTLEHAAYRARLTFDNGEISAWSRTAETPDNLTESTVPGTPEPFDEAPTPTPTPKAQDLDPGNCPQSFVSDATELVNAARLAAGLSALSVNGQLRVAAQSHADSMATSGNLSHDGWMTSITAAGYHGSKMGQNIASYFVTPKDVVTGWLQSPSHRQNILSTDWTETGVGCAKDPTGMLWWTQDFGVE